jgi:DnaJ-class molecular chaperone
MTACTFVCPACKGTGWHGDVLCRRCDALGTIDSITASDVLLVENSGVAHDHEIARFEDEGNPHG